MNKSEKEEEIHRQPSLLGDCTVKCGVGQSQAAQRQPDLRLREVDARMRLEQRERLVAERRGGARVHILVDRHQSVTLGERVLNHFA